MLDSHCGMFLTLASAHLPSTPPVSAAGPSAFVLDPCVFIFMEFYMNRIKNHTILVLRMAVIIQNIVFDIYPC